MIQAIIFWAIVGFVGTFIAGVLGWAGYGLWMIGYWWVDILFLLVTAACWWWLDD